MHSFSCCGLSLFHFVSFLRVQSASCQSIETSLLHFIVRANCKNVHLPSARQHPSYGDCLEIKSEYYQNSSVLGCVTQCQQHTHVSSSYRSSRLGLSHCDPYAVCRGGCLELYYCNMVEWSWWDLSLI